MSSVIEGASSECIDAPIQDAHLFSSWNALRAVAEAADAPLHELSAQFQAPEPASGKRQLKVKDLVAQDKESMAQYFGLPLYVGAESLTLAATKELAV